LIGNVALLGDLDILVGKTVSNISQVIAQFVSNLQILSRFTNEFGLLIIDNNMDHD
jgi:hypothetical protein